DLERVGGQLVVVERVEPVGVVGAVAADEPVDRLLHLQDQLAHSWSHTVRVGCEHVFVAYVELHAHTAFSFLDGASSPAELAAAAVEAGHGAMAVTDHNGVSGSMEFAMAAKPLGLRAIHGVEMDLVDGRHVTLLVENTMGWRNLCRIVTRAHRDDRLKHEPP